MSYQYNANDDLEIHAKLLALAEHFGVDESYVKSEADFDPERFVIDFHARMSFAVECVHAMSESFRIDHGLYTRVVGNGNNFYFFRVM